MKNCQKNCDFMKYYVKSLRFSAKCPARAFHFQAFLREDHDDSSEDSIEHLPVIVSSNIFHTDYGLLWILHID